MARVKGAVLIVEDESIVANDLQATLAALGFDAFAIAASAEEAMARAGERRPDVALVDVRIKGRLDGIKTAQLLRERFGIPIVYLTAHTDDATVERALKTRPYGYLLKPVKVPELRSAIESALRRPEPDTREGRSGASIPGITPPGASTREPPPPKARAVRRALAQVLASPDFDAPRRSREFLRFIVEETVAGRGEAISQTTIATEVFGRKDDFDAIVDPIVRIQAGRLRRSLERYYLLSGVHDPVRIELPRGTYVPALRSVNAVEAPATEGATQPANTQERSSPETEPSDGWPSLVVTGFESGPSGEVHELAVQAGEELALELGRYWAVRVLRIGESDGRQPAPSDHARFALGGRVRQERDGLRVSARLVDRTTGEQVWGDEYRTAPRRGQWSGSPGDAARVIAARVGGEEGVVVQLLAAERRKRKAAVTTPYDAILLSYEFFLARDPSNLLSAMEALRRVVAAEPDCGPAWTRLARLYLANYSFELTASPHPDRRGDHVRPPRRARRSREPERPLHTRLGAADQGGAHGRSQGAGRGSPIECRLPGLPRSHRLSPDLAGRLGAWARPEPKRPGAQSSLPAPGIARPLGRQPAPRRPRLRVPDRPRVSGPDVLLAASDASLLPRSPGADLGGQRRGGGAPVPQARLRGPGPHPPRPLHQVPRGDGPDRRRPGPGGPGARMTPLNLTAEEALARVREGNARFVRGEALFPITVPDIRVALATDQRPYATILGCSDSRVPPELVFGAGLGDLFVVRLAGNVVSAEVMGTLQYAATHLSTPLFIVLGHEGCGAVGAALAARLRGAREPRRIDALLQSILPGLAEVDAGLEPAALLQAAVEANVRWCLRQLRETPEVQMRVAEGVMKLVGAVYELETGRVRFLD